MGYTRITVNHATLAEPWVVDVDDSDIENEEVFQCQYREWKTGLHFQAGYREQSSVWIYGNDISIVKEHFDG